jgi:hypothetical protein
MSVRESSLIIIIVKDIEHFSTQAFRPKEPRPVWPRSYIASKGGFFASLFEYNGELKRFLQYGTSRIWCCHSGGFIQAVILDFLLFLSILLHILYFLPDKGVSEVCRGQHFSIQGYGDIIDSLNLL